MYSTDMKIEYAQVRVKASAKSEVSFFTKPNIIFLLLVFRAREIKILNLANL